MNKNLFFFAAVLATSLVANDQDNNAFQPKSYAWSLTYDAKDGDDEVIAYFNQSMRSLIDATKRSPETVEEARSHGSNVYQQFLNFLKEAQEAVIAGLNLFSAVTSSENVLTEVAEELVEEIITEELQDAVAADSNEVAVATDNVQAESKAVSVIVVIEANDASKVDLYNSIKAKLEALGQAVNDKTVTSDQVVVTLHEVYNMVNELQDGAFNLLAQ